jgi:hypothetical protein
MLAEQITQLSARSEENIYDAQFWKDILADFDAEEAEPEDSGDRE